MSDVFGEIRKKKTIRARAAPLISYERLTPRGELKKKFDEKRKQSFPRLRPLLFENFRCDLFAFIVDIEHERSKNDGGNSRRTNTMKDETRKDSHNVTTTKPSSDSSFSRFSNTITRTNRTTLEKASRRTRMRPNVHPKLLTDPEQIQTKPTETRILLSEKSNSLKRSKRTTHSKWQRIVRTCSARKKKTKKNRREHRPRTLRLDPVTRASRCARVVVGSATRWPRRYASGRKSIGARARTPNRWPSRRPRDTK